MIVSEQEADAASDSVVTQGPETENDARFAPPTRKPLSWRDELPIFDMVMVWVEAWPTGNVAKVTDVAEKEAMGPLAVPVPVSVTNCGEVMALSLTRSVAESGPVAVGAKAIEMVQELPLRSWAGQALVARNALALAPVMETPVNCMAVAPLLVRVTDWVAEVMPTGDEPKATAEVLRAALAWVAIGW